MRRQQEAQRGEAARQRRDERISKSERALLAKARAADAKDEYRARRLD